MSANAKDGSLSARLLLAVLWLFQWLPLSVQAACGSEDPAGYRTR